MSMKVEESIDFLNKRLQVLNNDITRTSTKRDVQLSNLYQTDIDLKRYKEERDKVQAEIDKFYEFKNWEDKDEQ